MAFFKFRGDAAQADARRPAKPVAPQAESVDTMRRRARHRLLGAAVLVLLGVIGFPLFFDSQPRPVAVDIPIVIPDRDKAKPLAIPDAGRKSSQSGQQPDAGTRDAAGLEKVAPAAGAVITESADGTDISAKTASPPETKIPPSAEAKARPQPEPRAETIAKAERKSEPKPEAKPDLKPEPKPKAEAKAEAKVDPTPARRDDGARARALLEGRKAPSAVVTSSTSDATQSPPTSAAVDDDKGRFVVQVGAFSDASAARETRRKLQQAGLKSFTQVAKTSEGERTRVRVGPFGSRAEADRAAGKVKGLSLPAVVLTL